MNQLITFDPQAIKQLDGLYCLNDLHRMAGSVHKQRPQYYLQSPRGKKILAIYEAENRASYICLVKGKGQKQGTYADLAIALDYASWIDTRFFILLSQYVRNAITSTPQITFNTMQDEVNFMTYLTKQIGNNGSIAGYVLQKCRFKKVVNRELQLALDRQQLQLALEAK